LKTPTLKSDATFAPDGRAGRDGNRIAVERIRYNGRIQAYNTQRRSFPHHAGIAGSRAEALQAPEEGKQVPTVDFTRPKT
jgi:hypothetical protein